MSLANLLTLARGKSGFGMIYSPVGRFLVASRFMRVLSGLANGVISGLLYLTWALAIKEPTILSTLHPLNQTLIFFTVTLCLMRGLPVIRDGRILSRADKNYPDPATPRESGHRWASPVFFFRWPAE